MSGFSLNNSLNYNPKAIVSISDAIYPHISNMVYLGMGLNSELDDVLFLNRYFTETFTKYYSLLEYLGYFTDRRSVQKYVDISSSIIAATIEYFYKTDVDEALRFFVNQFLKAVYDNTEFLIINIKLNSVPLQHKHKIIIEPIALQGSNLCDDEEANQAAELMISLLSYMENSDLCVSISIIKSNLWSCYNEKFPELIDDQNFAGLFENYPAIYKVVFKCRYHMLHDMGIETEDLSKYISLDKEAEIMYEDIIDTSGNNEYLNDADDELEIAEYSNIINDIYNRIINNNKQIAFNIRIDDLDLKHIIDMPVYTKVFKYLDSGRFNTWTIQKLSKKEYDYDATIDDEYDIKFTEDESYVDFEIDFTPDDGLLDALNELDADNADRPEVNSLPDNDNQIVYNIPAEDDSNELHQTTESNSIKKKSDDYQKFIPDYYTAKETELVLDLEDYISSTLNIYINAKGKINTNLIKKVITSYNKSDKIEVINIDDDRNNYIVEIKEATLGGNLRFTISKKDGTIKSIETKMK